MATQEQIAAALRKLADEGKSRSPEARRLALEYRYQQSANNRVGQGPVGYIETPPDIAPPEREKPLSGNERGQGRFLAMIPANLGDETVAAVKGAYDAVRSGDVTPIGPLPIPGQKAQAAASKGYNEQLYKARDIQKRYSAQAPWWEPLALGAPAGVAIGMMTGNPTSIGGAMAQGAGIGGAYGFGGGEGFEDRLSRGALNAGVGAVTQIPFHFAGRALTGSTSKSPAVDLLRNEGVRPTIGQALGGKLNVREESLASLPLGGGSVTAARQHAVQDLNRAAYNRVLAPLGQKVAQDSQVGHSAINMLHSAISKSYDDLLDKVTVPARLDKKFVATVGQVRQGLIADLPEERTLQFDKQIKRILDLMASAEPKGGLPGRSFKHLDSHLGDMTRKYLGASDADQNSLGYGIAQMHMALRDMIARQNPKFAAQLMANNKAYAQFIRIADASGKASDGVFSAAQLDQSVRKLANSAITVARGKGLMQDLSSAGAQVLNKPIGNSGTAERSAWLHPLSALATSPVGVAAHGAYGTQTGRRALDALVLGNRPPAVTASGELLKRLGAPSAALAAGLLSAPSY